VAAAVVGFGAVALAVGLAWPPGRERPASSGQWLDRFLPVYDVNEVNAITIRATPRQVDEAIRSVRPSEVRFLHTLFRLRSLAAGDGAGSVAEAFGDRPLVPGPGQPGGLILLAHRPEHEFVVGAVGFFWELRGAPLMTLTRPEEFRAFETPGLAQMAINVRIEDRGEGECRVVTETRVRIRGEESRKRFFLYWKLIHPGSAMLRLSWLQAIKRRAERSR
jgi:hypothetical protein